MLGKKTHKMHLPVTGGREIAIQSWRDSRSHKCHLGSVGTAANEFLNSRVLVNC